MINRGTNEKTQKIRRFNGCSGVLEKHLADQVNFKLQAVNESRFENFRIKTECHQFLRPTLHLD